MITTMKIKYQYSLKDTNHNEVYHFESEIEAAGCDLADEAAEDYHYNHGGFESVWPIEFRLYDENGGELGTYLVERDVTPYFISEEITKN
jgi:hypothetical protein